jgi:hypothetical protein
MKSDLYTKAVLTVIAITLTGIACNQYIEPKATVQAQAAPFAGVQFSGGDRAGFFDPRTGEVALVDMSPGATIGQVYARLKMGQVGKRLTLICGGNGTYCNETK